MSGLSATLSTPEGKTASAEQAQLMRKATRFSVVVAIILIFIKFIAWSFTDSLSLLSSLVDSLLDVLSSLINLMAVRYALQPPDDEHRFGHGKAEDIAGLMQSAFIAGSGLFICVEAIKRLYKPEVVSHGSVGIGVMLFSIFLTAMLVLYQRYVIRKTGSVVISADLTHYMMDLLTNSGVIIAFLLTTGMGWQWADPLFAILISFYIFKGAWEVGSRAFQHLMDRECSDEERETIEGIALSHDMVRGIHDLRTRRSGIYSFIQFHLDMDADLTLQQAHDIAEEVESMLQKS